MCCTRDRGTAMARRQTTPDQISIPSASTRYRQWRYSICGHFTASQISRPVTGNHDSANNPRAHHGQGRINRRMAAVRRCTAAMVMPTIAPIMRSSATTRGSSAWIPGRPVSAGPPTLAGAPSFALSGSVICANLPRRMRRTGDAGGGHVSVSPGAKTKAEVQNRHSISQMLAAREPGPRRTMKSLEFPDGAPFAGRRVMEASRRGTVVLVAEDDPHALSGYLEFLNRSGFVASGSGDGREALGLAVETVPDIVVTDIMMPG